MKIYWIKEPVWGERSVYVHRKRINQVVGIKYRDTAGNQVFPKVINLTPSKVKNYTTRKFKWGTAWRIPVEEFE